MVLWSVRVRQDNSTAYPQLQKDPSYVHVMTVNCGSDADHRDISTEGASSQQTSSRSLSMHSAGGATLPCTDGELVGSSIKQSVIAMPHLAAQRSDDVTTSSSIQVKIQQWRSLPLTAAVWHVLTPLTATPSSTSWMRVAKRGVKRSVRSCMAATLSSSPYSSSNAVTAVSLTAASWRYKVLLAAVMQWTVYVAMQIMLSCCEQPTLPLVLQNLS